MTKLRWLIPVLLIGAAAYAVAEDVTLTTYYPSPRGVYKDLRVTGTLDVNGDAQVNLHNAATGAEWREGSVAAGQVPGSASVPGSFMLYKPNEAFPLTVLPNSYIGLNHSNPQFPLTIYAGGGGPAPTSTFAPTVAALYYADGISPLFSIYTYPGPGGANVFCPQDGSQPFGSYTVLCLGKPTTSGSSINAAGSINSNLGDFAERIPWDGKPPAPGTIIKYQGSFLVVSSPETAAFVGNAGHEDAGTSVLIAFAGQVPVRVRGAVHAGDYIVPNTDGTGRAVAPEAVTFEQYRQVVGTAWEASEHEEEKPVLVAIGIK